MANESTDKEARERYNVILPEVVRQQAHELAKDDRRSFSNLVEVLIVREYERRFGAVPANATPEPNPAEQAA